jgi:hypothetical protein
VTLATPRLRWSSSSIAARCLTGIVAALVGMVQVRTLDSLAWMAGSSAIAIMLAMTLLMIDFAVFDVPNQNSNTNHSHNTSAAMAWSTAAVGYEYGAPSLKNNTDHGHLWPEKGLSFMDLYGSTATFVFAFQGQSIFFEIMREMKVPTNFKKAVTVATTMMIGVYLATISLCYYFKGDTVAPFLPASMANPTLRKIVGGLVAFNLYSAYLLTNVPLALAWHQRLAPATARDFTGFKAKVHWFLLTSAILIFSFLVRVKSKTHIVPSILRPPLVGLCVWFVCQIFCIATRLFLHARRCCANRYTGTLVDSAIPPGVLTWGACGRHPSLRTPPHPTRYTAMQVDNAIPPRVLTIEIA